MPDLRPSPYPSAPRAGGVGRRTLLRGLGLGGAALAVGGLAACTPGQTPAPADPASPGASAGSGASDTAAATTSGSIDAAGVQRGLAALPDIIQRAMTKTTLPGLAAVVVYEGKTVYLEGFGLRDVSKTDKVDADTVFSLASVSKPISSTVVAAALTAKLPELGWDDPVHNILRDLGMADPWVLDHVTAADLFAHRTGLPDHSGNLLEDLGFGRAEILRRHRFYPLRRFRDNYEYTNYGLTAGGEAIARSSGKSWEDLAQQVLFAPLKMTSSSFAFADLEGRSNRAAMHDKVDGTWTPHLDFDYDPQAPAGSASSSARDIGAWLTMLVQEGKPVTEVEQLQRIWLPAVVRPGLPELGTAANFYGLGWNVNYEATGELRASHSGAFAQGAATAVTVFPSKQLAVAVLTNGYPMGVPEAVIAEFTDVVRHGRSTQDDWLAVIAPFVTPEETADQKKYATAATDPTAARSPSTYVGTYQNRLYGPLTVSARGDDLSFTIGPKNERYALQHFSGDDFFFSTRGEDASGFSGLVFTVKDGRATSLTVNAWNEHDLGTFTRS